MTKPVSTTDKPMINRDPERPTVAPRVDVFENKDELLLAADLPGADQSTLKLHLDKDELTIDASTTAEADGNILEREFQPVNYHRSFRVPKGIDHAKVDADMKEGVLWLHLRKSEAVKPRQIEVKAE